MVFKLQKTKTKEKNLGRQKKNRCANFIKNIHQNQDISKEQREHSRMINRSALQKKT